MYDCIIIGGGPAGYTAAIYAGRAALKTLLLAGYGSGGQLMVATEIEDYPGFPEGVQGPELSKRMRAQAERFAEIKEIDVKSVDLSSRPFKVKTDEGTFEAKTLIIATGAKPKLLGLPSESEYLGKGVSVCAVCDGFFFRDKDVAIVGGGDTAMREALYLANICNSVSVIHRRDKLRAQAILQERAKSNPKIKFVWNSIVEEVLGDGRKVTGLKIKNVKTNKVSELKVDGVFIAIGHIPNTEFLHGQLELDEQGYIVLKNRTETSIPGVFAAGDVADRKYRQAITAAAAGCCAALDAREFLEGK